MPIYKRYMIGYYLTRKGFEYSTFSAIMLYNVHSTLIQIAHFHQIQISLKMWLRYSFMQDVLPLDLLQIPRILVYFHSQKSDQERAY